MMSTTPYTAIGIDPGVNTGIAVWTPSLKLLSLATTSAYDSLYAVQQLYRDYPNSIFYIEDPNGDKAAFTSMLNHATKATMLAPSQRKSALRTSIKIAQDVGKVKAHAQHIIERLESLGAVVVKVNPSRRRKAGKTSDPRLFNMPVKLTSAQFEQLTGYPGSTNEHVRDAATLVYHLRDREIAVALKRRPTPRHFILKLKHHGSDLVHPQ